MQPKLLYCINIRSLAFPPTVPRSWTKESQLTTFRSAALGIEEPAFNRGWLIVFYKARFYIHHTTRKTGEPGKSDYRSKQQLDPARGE
jgi:hypothetical protein